MDKKYYLLSLSALFGMALLTGVLLINATNKKYEIPHAQNSAVYDTDVKEHIQPNNADVNIETLEEDKNINTELNHTAGSSITHFEVLEYSNSANEEHTENQKNTSESTFVPLTIFEPEKICLPYDPLKSTGVATESWLYEQDDKWVIPGMLEQGNEVYAIYDGYVVSIDVSEYETNTLTINHGNGHSSVYTLIENIQVEVGDFVKKEQIIAHVGKTADLKFVKRVNGFAFKLEIDGEDFGFGTNDNLFNELRKNGDIETLNTLMSTGINTRSFVETWISMVYQ